MNGTTLTLHMTLLPPGQARVLAFVEEYYAVAREPCPARLVARRFSLHHETVRETFSVLYRKGWLRTNSSPATPEKPIA